MVCQSCKQQRQSVRPVQSKLVGGARIYLCQECRSANMEPRHLIIIAARSGIDVSEYIKKGRYVGDPILASEITT